MGYIHIIILLVAYLKLKFNWASSISPANPRPQAKKSTSHYPYRRRQRAPSNSGWDTSGQVGGPARRGPAPRRMPPPGAGHASLPGGAPPWPRRQAPRAIRDWCVAPKWCNRLPASRGQRPGGLVLAWIAWRPRRSYSRWT